MRRFVEDLFAFLLSDASEYAENLTLARVPLELLQPAEDLLLGFVTDAASVV